MTFYFFDTSALVKRYHLEPGSERVNAIPRFGLPSPTGHPETTLHAYQQPAGGIAA